MTRSIPHWSLRLALPLLAGLFVATAHAARRPGAARPLPLDWSAGHADAAGTTRDGVVAPYRGAKGGYAPYALYFTAESGGTQNIWRAVPRLAGPTPADDDDHPDLGARQVRWEAAPLTTFAAPTYADQPAASADGKHIVFVTGTTAAAGSAEHSRIMSLDVNSGRTKQLTDDANHNYAPVISPDGRRVAFVSDRIGFDAIFVAPTEGGAARRVVSMAGQPCWLSDSTLLFQNLRPGNPGLYKVEVPAPGTMQLAPHTTLLFPRGGPAALSPDGRQICVAAQSPNGGSTTAPKGMQRLYLLSTDGSGARAVPGTDGAAAPAFLPDGSGILFDAPVGADPTAGRRALWMLSMTRVPPVAILIQARPPHGAAMPGPSTAVEIVGTVFTEDALPPRIVLEVGAGDDPRRFTPITVEQTAFHTATIATWQPPTGATGAWTVRVTVTDSTGDVAQSTLQVSLPLVNEPTDAVPIGDVPTVNNGAPSITTSPVLGGPVYPAPTATPAPRPAATPRPNPTPPPARPAPAKPVLLKPAPPKAIPGQLPILPLPALPPAPGEATLAPATLPKTPPPVAPAPRRKLWFPPVSSPVHQAPSPPGAAPKPPAPTPPIKAQPPMPVAPIAPRKQPATAPKAAVATPAAASVGADTAAMSITGTPATMMVGEKLPVTAHLRNTGARGWSSQEAQPVKLVYRWYDLNTGWRTRWSVEWLTATVPPGGKLDLPVELTAPGRPGRFVVSYALLRMDGKQVTPPAPKEGRKRWPGEFASKAYRVVIEAAPPPPQSTSR